jgi:hypothetical protein
VPWLRAFCRLAANETAANGPRTAGSVCCFGRHCIAIAPALSETEASVSLLEE